jgi:hypothetical protein
VIALVIGAAGFVLGGPVLGLALTGGWMAWVARPRKKKSPPVRPVLLMLLVELRSGLSVLAALRSVAGRFPDYQDLAVATSMASVAGVDEAINASRGEVKVLMTHLARASASGGSAADAVRRMLESDFAREKADRLARARALPVRLMIPVTLLLLPGVVLLVYGPTIVSLIDDLAIPF